MIQKMMKALKKKNNQKGFTLVELMIVVLIIGILVTIAAVSYSGIELKAARVVHDSNLKQIDNVVEQYKLDHNGGLPYDMKDIQSYFKSGLIPEVPHALQGEIRDSFYYLRGDFRLASPLSSHEGAYSNEPKTTP